MCDLSQSMLDLSGCLSPRGCPDLTRHGRASVNLHGIPVPGAVRSRGSFGGCSPVHAKCDIGKYLEAMWCELDEGLGAVTYDDVAGLLVKLGVVMEKQKEVEFFKEVDPEQTGTVGYRRFAVGFGRFKESGEFTKVSSTLEVAVRYAVSCGVTPQFISRLWHQYDEGCVAITHTEFLALLTQVDIHALPADVKELLRSLNADPLADVRFATIIPLFYSESQSVPEFQSSIFYRPSQGFVKSPQRPSGVLPIATRLPPLRSVYKIAFFVYTHVNLIAPFMLYAFAADDVWTPALSVLLLSDIVMYWKFYSNGASHLHCASSTWLIADIIIMLPLEILVWPYFMSPILRMNKLLLLSYVQEGFTDMFGSLLGPIWSRISHALYCWLLTAHYTACAFHLVSLSVGDKATWYVLTINDYSQLSRLHQYLQSFSYALNTLSGLSRGIFPDNDVQAALALAVVLLGVWVYALVLSSIAQALTFNSEEQKHRTKVEQLRTELAAWKLPSSFIDECVGCHKYVYRSKASFHIDDDLLADLPQQLSVGISVTLGRELLQKVPIFQEASRNDEFVYALQQCLELIVAPPGYHVIGHGDEGLEMYFITQGSCSVYSQSGEKLQTLRKGDFFGEIALLADVPRTASVVTDTYCSLLELSAADFLAIVNCFPDLRQQIESQANDRIKLIKRGRKPSGSLRRPSVQSRNSDDESLIDWIRRTSSIATSLARSASGGSWGKGLVKTKSNGSSNGGRRTSNTGNPLCPPAWSYNNPDSPTASFMGLIAPELAVDLSDPNDGSKIPLYKRRVNNRRFSRPLDSETAGGGLPPLPPRTVSVTTPLITDVVSEGSAGETEEDSGTPVSPPQPDEHVISPATISLPSADNDTYSIDSQAPDRPMLL